MINPALAQNPQEAVLIGMMVVGYGELDISMVQAAGLALGLMPQLLDALEEVYSEDRRIKLIGKLAAPAMEAAGLAEPFQQGLLAMNECREIRNLYAHCHYGDFGRGLVFCKARDLFAPGRYLGAEALPWRETTIDTLAVQADFFEYARKCWVGLAMTLQQRGLRRPVSFQAPPKRSAPKRDNGPMRPLDPPAQG